MKTKHEDDNFISDMKVWIIVVLVILAVIGALEIARDIIPMFTELSVNCLTTKVFSKYHTVCHILSSFPLG